MESSDNRRQSDVLPSINYGGFEQQQREGAHFHQRHPSIARTSISAASPVSPTTMFGPPSLHSYPQAPSNGIHTPPESRRTSDDQVPSAPGRQSLPSLHEVFEKPGSFSAPQTPPIGSGPFSAAPPLPRTNSIPNSMPRSQPSEPGLHSSSQPQTPLLYTPVVPQPQAASHPPPHPAPAPHSHETPYARHDSQTGGRTLPPNPYSQAQPPPSIPAMHPPDAYPPPPPPPPPASSLTQHHVHAPSYPHAPYQHQSSQPPAPHYSSPTSSFNGVAPPPHQSTHQYPPYAPSSHPHPHPHQHPPPPPPRPTQPQHQPPYQPQHTQQSQYPYPPPQQRDPGYQPEVHKGVKRGSGYGSAIERALSISTLRRDLDTIKDNASRIYHIVEQYQNLSANGQQPHPAGLHASLQEFAEALRRSQQNTEALNNCHQVFQELSHKEQAEQNSHKLSVGHGDYGVEDGQQYQDDNRSNGSQQPEKKMRRGRAVPPGRCHSCHRAETPEWRRGPDGARTLCNACGLHYAKLTRKLNKNPAGPGALTARKSSNSPLQ